MEKIKFKYKSPNFSSKIVAEGELLGTTKYYVGENEVDVKIAYYKGFVHHVYNKESISNIEVISPR